MPGESTDGGVKDRAGWAWLDWDWRCCSCWPPCRSYCSRSRDAERCAARLWSRHWMWFVLMDLHAVSGGAVVSLGTMHIRLASIHLTSFRQASKDARVRDLIRKLQQPDEDIEQETETGRLKQKHTDADTEKGVPPAVGSGRKLRRHRRRIAHECCKEGCTYDDILDYCAWWPGWQNKTNKNQKPDPKNQKYQMNTTWLRFCVAARGKHPTTGRLFAIHFPTTLNP